MPESLSQERPVATVVTIQYLRAVAAALIVFQHAMGIPAFVYYTAHFGTVGVDSLPTPIDIELKVIAGK